MCYNGFVRSARFFPALVSHARPFTQPLDGPRGSSNSSKIFPSQAVISSPTLRLHKSFSCNTYGSPRKCCKQKTYGRAKSFRCNTYKKRGVGVFFPIWKSLRAHGDENSHFIQVLSFHIVAHSFARRKILSPFVSSTSALFAQNNRGWGTLSAIIPPRIFRERGSARSFPIFTSLLPYGILRSVLT